MYTGIDHHWKEPVFATCGHQVDIWDEQRTSPLCSLTWGVDSISSVKFNPIEVIICSYTPHYHYCHLSMLVIAVWNAFCKYRNIVLVKEVKIAPG